MYILHLGRVWLSQYKDDITRRHYTISVKVLHLYPCSVDKGLKANSVNYQKRTALHLAVIGRNEEVVRALLKVGASVNIQVSSTFKEYIL